VTIAQDARSPASPAADGRAEQRSRHALGTGAAGLAVGLGLVGTGPSDVGMVVTLASLIVLIYGVHTFGRLGPS
jgi:hypothetical protein